jgi:catechol 2,3-dioxygenase-like lactoylglutathione lyase family enzyme
MEFRGVNHITLVTHDMAETVDFYQNVLEMPVVKAVETLDGGQQFYFDAGAGRLLSFLWWPDAPERAPGVASMHQDFAQKGIQTAHGSMNHLAIGVELDRFHETVERMKDKNISTRVVDHGQFLSVYFRDNNNIHMEFAALAYPFTNDKARIDPVNDKGVKVHVPIKESV